MAMRIEILKTFLDGRDRYEKGEIRMVSDKDGEYFCSTFGAKDVDGMVPTSELKPGVTKLDIRSIMRTRNTEVSGG